MIYVYVLTRNILRVKKIPHGSLFRLANDRLTTSSLIRVYKTHNNTYYLHTNSVYLRETLNVWDRISINR